MKNNLFKFAALTLISITSLFTNISKAQTVDELLKDSSKKSEIIAAIAGNDALSGEVMDAIMSRHRDKMMSKMSGMMMNDKQMQPSMMMNMMDMADKDSSMCSMMMGMMSNHSNIMKHMGTMMPGKGMMNMQDNKKAATKKTTQNKPKAKKQSDKSSMNDMKMNK